MNLFVRKIKKKVLQQKKGRILFFQFSYLVGLLITFFYCANNLKQKKKKICNLKRFFFHFIYLFFIFCNKLNLIYAHPSLRSSSFSGGGGREEEEGATSPLIGFHLTHTQLFWRGDASNVNPLTRETAPKYLETFCDFARDENTRGFRWDHALLLTGVDLKFPNGTNYGVAGNNKISPGKKIK